MKQNNKSPTFAVAMAVVIIFVKAWTCAAQTTPASLVDDEVLRFKKKAEKVGCVVQEGLPVKTNLNDLYCNGLMWAPLYPNPNAPYISSMLPHVPGQANPVVSNGSFRLREDEAIVVIGVQKARGCGPGSCVLFVPGTLLEAGIGVAAGRKRPQCRVGRSHPWLGQPPASGTPLARKPFPASQRDHRARLAGDSRRRGIHAAGPSGTFLNKERGRKCSANDFSTPLNLLTINFSVFQTVEDGSRQPILRGGNRREGIWCS